MPTPRTRYRDSYHPQVPFFRNLARIQSGWDGDHKTVYPYSTVFEVVKGTCYNPFSNTYTAYDAGNAPGSFQIPSHKLQSSYNRAYGAFNGRARGAIASLGATLGEYSQTSRMVKGRAISLYDFSSKLLRRYNRNKRRKPPSWRKRFRSFADYWLEYSFGWSPLFGDMYSAMKVLCGNPDPVTCFGTGSAFHEGESGGGNPRHSFFYQYTVKVFGTLRVSNPNYAFANNLGLANPAAVAWELVPWSFVVDWMTDMGSWIGSWTDGFGFELLASGVSKKQIGTTVQTWDSLLGQSKSTSVVAERLPGVSLPLPNLDILENVGKNLKRAANAIALTTQLVLSGKIPRIPRGAR